LYLMMKNKTKQKFGFNKSLPLMARKSYYK
jgi:hypothetical protein